MKDIQALTQPEHFKEIFSHFAEINPGYSSEELANRMFYQIRAGVFKIVGSVNDENKLDGFILYEITIPFSEPELFIWLCWISPNKPELGRIYMDYIENRAIKYRCKKISMATKDRETAWQRKYGFEPESVIMSKPIKLPFIEEIKKSLIIVKGV